MMRRRILAAILSILLTVSFILSLPVTVRANTWDETIDRYDQLFSADKEPAAKFKELYKAFLLDSRTFTNQLAFRDKEVKDYVLSVLTGDWVTPEHLENMENAIRFLISYDFDDDVSQTELHLWQDMMDHFTYLELRDIGVITDCSKLFLQVAAIENDYNYSLAPSLAYAIIGTPDVFLRTLLEEEETVQERTVLMLGSYNTDFIGTKICNSLPEYSADTESELAALRQQILLALEGCPQLPIQTNPDPKELQQWQQEGYSPQVTIDCSYSDLLNTRMGLRMETFLNAMFYDTANWVNELAFRDAKTKRAFLNGIRSANYDKASLLRMSLHLQDYLETTASLTKSETALLEAYIYQLDYFYYSLSHAHRNRSDLFAEAMVHPLDNSLNDFCDELKFAFISNPSHFIMFLVTEDEAVQDTVVRYLCADSDSSDALIIKVAELLAQERDRTDYYSDAEYAVLMKLCSNIQMLPSVPEPTDPNPTEHAQWLADQQLAEIENQDTFPTMTTPSTIEPSEKNTSNYRLLSTILLCVAAFALGIPIGLCYVNRKERRAKENAPATPPAPDEEDILW